MIMPQLDSDGFVINSYDAGIGFPVVADSEFLLGHRSNSLE